LASSCYCQHHVNCCIFLFQFKTSLLIFEHLQSCLSMQTTENFMIETTTTEIRILIGRITNFVILISFIGLFGCLQSSRNFMYLYLFFVPSTGCSNF
jgi:UDP-3-O-acyl-N-acetylglucosamine deacetylase